ncbi:MAG: hypothetical protein LBG19_05130 [Prevotellaceae bacterium]|jgi:putative iron-only hydrogenase system regulator|nr:hypothetical protein [Prevotellaceae bacterium]
MEKRIGAALIVVENKNSVPRLNSLLSEHSEIIVARQGLPLQEKGISVISLVLEGGSQQLNALIGPIGKLEGVTVKSMMMPNKKD